jgi:hypothetical protein
MTFTKTNFSYIIIAVLIAVIFLQRSCSPTTKDDKEILKINGNRYKVLKREIDTVIVPVTHNVYKSGKDIYHDVPIYIQIPLNADTAAILKEYFAMHIYKDTLQLKDSLGFVSVIDTITKNGLMGREWNVKVNKITINNTTYLKELPKTQLYLGGTLGIQTPTYTTIGCNAILKTKNDRIYGIGIGINSQLNTYIQGSIFWKISLNK